MGWEIDFAKLLLSVTHDSDFKASTTYPFSCMIFNLRMYVGDPIWHRSPLCTAAGIVDIGLITNEPMWLHRKEGLELICSH